MKTNRYPYMAWNDLLAIHVQRGEDNMSNSNSRKWIPVVPAAALLLLTLAILAPAVSAAAEIWVPEGGNQTIQQAVNNATPGDTIIVADGTYTENVDVNVDHLTIRSQNGSANCIVNAANPNDHVFKVAADYVNISGFTATGATGTSFSGIYLNSAQHCKISENNASGNYYGIYLDSSSDNTLTENTANSNEYGIDLYSSSDNTLTNNTANSNTYYGIWLCFLSDNNTLTSNIANSNEYGIWLSSSNSNTLTENIANSNGCGIHLWWWSSDNTLTNNTANSNKHGIWLCSSTNNNVSCNWVQNNTEAGFYLVHGSTGNTIANNSIIANGVVKGDGSYQWQFRNNQSDEVSTADNWWGTADTTIINASIYDQTYDAGWGSVTTAPRLSGPAPCAPVPELPTIALLAVGLSLLAGYVRIERRK